MRMSKLEWMILIVILDLALIFCIITLAILANATTIQFAWEHDGNCAGFILYMSEMPTVYNAAKIAYIPNPSARTCTIIYQKLTGQKYWTMRAYDNASQLSAQSNEVTSDLTTQQRLTPVNILCTEGK